MKSLQVVGVVKDSYLGSVADAPVPLLYTPFCQNPDKQMRGWRFAFKAIRAILPVLRRAIAEARVTSARDGADDDAGSDPGVFMQARLTAAVLLLARVLALV